MAKESLVVRLCMKINFLKIHEKPLKKINKVEDKKII